MDTTNATPPIILPKTVPLSALTGGEQLLQRHKGNPYGRWQPLATAGDWRGENYIVAALVEGEWTRVSFLEMRGGRPAGVVETKPRKKKTNKKSEANDKITVDG